MEWEKWKNRGLFSLKKSIIWSIPSIILIIIVSIQAVIYVNEIYDQTKRQTILDVQDVAGNYASELENRLDALASQARPMATLLGSVSNSDKRTIANSLNSIKDSTDAYQVLYADTAGYAITESGDSVSVVSENYFLKEESLENQFIYTERELITGNSAIVISVPVYTDSQIKGYLLLYYATNQFETLFSSSEFSKMAFYALSDNEGNVFSLDGYPSRMVEKGANLFDTISLVNLENEQQENFSVYFTHRASGYVVANVGNEEKWLFYEPVNQTNVMVLMGVDNSYLTKQINLDMNPTYSFVGYLILFILLYIGIMFAMLIIRRIHQRKNDPRNEIDSKTGLYIREAAEKRVKEYMDNQPNSLAAFFVIDIDNFAKLNEKEGRSFGDGILKSLGEQLKKQFREYDIISRYETDQFMVFLKYFPDVELLMREARHVADTFCNVSFEEKGMEISTSIGCSIFPNNASTVEDLYNTANEAMNVAKSMGKDQMVFYEEIKPDEAFFEES